VSVVSGRLETFERDIKVATAGLEPDAIAKELARFAREELRKALADGSGSAMYEMIVNGRRGLSEDAVTPPGPIVYVFTHWPQVISTALTELRKRVPVRSGRYSGGFIVLVNGRIVQSFTDIPADAEVAILNVRPYTRKMEVGALGRGRSSNGPGAGHFRKTRMVIERRFRGAFVCEDRFLNVGGGLHPGVPYILKGALQRSRNRDRSSRRPDRQPGMPITYPALIINRAD
jgi:hypothetical protein